MEELLNNTQVSATFAKCSLELPEEDNYTQVICWLNSNLFACMLSAIFFLAQMLFAYRITSFEDLQTCGFQYTFNWLCHWVSIWDNRKRFHVHTFYPTAWLALLLAIGWSLLVRITSYTTFIKSSLSALRAQAETKNSENLMIPFSSVTMQPWEFYNNMCLDWVSEKVHKSNVIWSGGKLQTLKLHISRDLSIQYSHKVEIFFLRKLKQQISTKANELRMSSVCWDKNDSVTHFGYFNHILRLSQLHQFD